MQRLFYFRQLLLALAATAHPAVAELQHAATPAEITPVASLKLPKGGGEIIAYDAPRQQLVATLSHGKTGRHGALFIDVSAPEKPVAKRELLLGDLLGDYPADAVTSVAVDPLGRGFGALVIVPEDSHARAGRLVLFDLENPRWLRAFSVGHHPDNVIFSPDGAHILTANEGELPGPSEDDAPGGISVLRVAGLDKEGVRALPPDAARTYDFSGWHLSDALFDRLRPLPAGAAAPRADIEPEYLASDGRHVFASLQENNAIGVFGLAERRWVALHDLGSLPKLIDVSDRDSADGHRSPALDDAVGTLPQPDTIGAFSIDGRTYIATANEGEGRDDFAVRLGGAVSAPQSPLLLDSALLARLRAHYKGQDPLADRHLGRALVSALHGDTDGDGDLDRIDLFGGRGFSIVSAKTGEVVFDSGNFMEAYIAEHDPKTFNQNVIPYRVDERSDESGPETEALTLAKVAGRQLLFVGNERHNSIFLFDISDPLRPKFLAYHNPTLAGHYAPESLVFVPGGGSASGKHTLFASFEFSGTMVAFTIEGL